MTTPIHHTDVHDLAQMSEQARSLLTFLAGRPSATPAELQAHLGMKYDWQVRYPLRRALAYGHAREAEDGQIRLSQRGRAVLRGETITGPCPLCQDHPDNDFFALCAAHQAQEESLASDNRRAFPGIALSVMECRSEEHQHIIDRRCRALSAW